MTTQRRMPSGQGPTRRPASGGGASRVRHTGSTRVSRDRAARPAVSRRTGPIGPGTTKRTVARKPRALTGRASVLIVVFVALALAYTYPLRVYLQQESQIAQLQAGQADQRKTIAQESEELAKWQDPAYVEAQARERYYYVRPGETPLLVYSDPVAAAHDAGKSSPATQPQDWYDTLWNSVRDADAESPAP